MTKWGICDVAAAAENLMLAATDRGLATCWLGIMDFEGIRKKFNLPERVETICLVTLGYPKEEIKKRAERKKIGELVHWGKW